MFLTQFDVSNCAYDSFFPFKSANNKRKKKAKKAKKARSELIEKAANMLHPRRSEKVLQKCLLERSEDKIQLPF